MEAVTGLWQSATAFFQTEAVDLWVNNAGVMGEKEGWRLCMDINLTGVLHGTNLAIRWKILFYPTLNVL